MSEDILSKIKLGLATAKPYDPTQDLMMLGYWQGVLDAPAIWSGGDGNYPPMTRDGCQEIIWGLLKKCMPHKMPVNEARVKYGDLLVDAAEHLKIGDGYVVDVSGWVDLSLIHPQDVISLAEAERIWDKTNLRNFGKGRIYMWQSGKTWLTTRQAMTKFYGEPPCPTK